MQLRQNIAAIFIVLFHINTSFVFAEEKPYGFEGTIIGINNAHSVTIELYEIADLSDIFVIHSQDDPSLVMGTLFLKQVNRSSHKSIEYQADVKVHANQGLIRPGDFVEKVDFTKAKVPIEGRADLLLTKRQVASRYKPLVYQGILSGETAATLDKDEFLCQMLSQCYWGATNRIMASTTVLLDIVGVPSLGVKYKLIDHPDFIVSPRVAFTFVPSLGKGASQFGLSMDLPTNSKFVSHLDLGLGYDQTGQGKAVFKNSLQSTSEMVLSNWNRLLFGPRYNFDEKSVGGHFGYLMIWQHLHWLTAVQTDNFTKFTWGLPGYVAYIELFWRWGG